MLTFGLPFLRNARFWFTMVPPALYCVTFQTFSKAVGIYNGEPYPLHSDGPIVNIWPHWLPLRFCFSFPAPFPHIQALPSPFENLLQTPRHFISEYFSHLLRKRAFSHITARQFLEIFNICSVLFFKRSISLTLRERERGRGGGRRG